MYRIAQQALPEYLRHDVLAGWLYSFSQRLQRLVHWLLHVRKRAHNERHKTMTETAQRSGIITCVS